MSATSPAAATARLATTRALNLACARLNWSSLHCLKLELEGVPQPPPDSWNMGILPAPEDSMHWGAWELVGGCGHGSRILASPAEGRFAVASCGGHYVQFDQASGWSVDTAPSESAWNDSHLPGHLARLFARVRSIDPKGKVDPTAVNRAKWGDEVDHSTRQWERFKAGYKGTRLHRAAAAKGIFPA